jgi:phage terminase small subunit
MPPIKNLRQETFCHEYIKDGDKCRAYRASGYHPKNDNSCNVLVCQLLKNVNVKARLREMQQRIAAKVEINAVKVLNELARIGTSDIRKAVGRNGCVLDPAEWDDDMAAAISSIKVEKLFEGKGKDKVHIGYTQELKLWDKNTALGNLAKHFKLLGDDPLPGGDTYNFNITMPANLRDTTHVANGHGPKIIGNGNGSGD